jgi:hypothetical protein
MSTTDERTSRDEEALRRLRRSLIADGYSVSLIGYDPSRDLYAFDVLQGPA